VRAKTAMSEAQVQAITQLLQEHRQTIAIVAGVLAVGGTAIGMWLSRYLHIRSRVRDVVKSAAQQRHVGGGRGNDLNSIEKRLRHAEKQKSEKQKPKRTTEDRLAAAGIPVDAKQFWQISGGLALAGAAVALLLKQGPAMLLMLAIVMGLGLPRLVLAFLARRRKKQFLSNLPDALDVMVRGLKAGLPVNEALKMIGKEFKGPIAREFAIVTDEQSAGYSLGDALERCAKRMPLPEMHMLAIAIAIQAQTGGSLSETLQNLSDVIRARFKLKRKVSAMTSEAKASAGIIGSLPFLLSATIVVVAPDYMNPMFDTLLGNMLATGALLWMLLGIAIMIKMIHFKV